MPGGQADLSCRSGKAPTPAPYDTLAAHPACACACPENIVERFHMRQLSILTVCMCHMLEASYICGPPRAALTVFTIVQIKDE